MDNNRFVRKICGKSNIFRKNFNVFISSDRIHRQRDYFNEIKPELEQKKSLGEDVVLKFIRGVPIVRLLN